MSDTKARRKAVFAKLDVAELTVVFLGVLFLTQPLSKGLFTIGFPVVFIGFLSHVLFDHLS